MFFEDCGQLTDHGFVAIFVEDNGVLSEVTCDNTRSQTGLFAAYYTTNQQNIKIYINLGSEKVSVIQKLKVMCFDKMGK